MRLSHRRFALLTTPLRSSLAALLRSFRSATCRYLGTELRATRNPMLPYVMDGLS
jgi:hypothetical protein